MLFATPLGGRLPVAALLFVVALLPAAGARANGAPDSASVGRDSVAVPAAMSRRMPRARLRSNFSAGLVSKK